MKKIALLAFLSIIAINVMAQEFTIGGISYSEEDETTVSLDKCPAKKSGNIKVPATVKYKGKTYTVTLICGEAFAECKKITSVTIPETVTYIGKKAFANCTALTRVTLPNSLEVLEKGAFSGCTALKTIILPNKLETINPETFVGCESLAAVIFSNSTKTIGDNAFVGCKSIKSIKLPESLRTIGEAAFLACTSLSSVTIPQSVREIGMMAFGGCYLTSFTNNSSASSAEHLGFEKVETETPEGLLINGTNLTKCRPWATSVTIPDNVTSIKLYAFSGCSDLTSIIIPSSVTTIDETAFKDCHFKTFINKTNLTSETNWGATLK